MRRLLLALVMTTCLHELMLSRVNDTRRRGQAVSLATTRREPCRPTW